MKIWRFLERNAYWFARGSVMLSLAFIVVTASLLESSLACETISEQAEFYTTVGWLGLAGETYLKASACYDEAVDVFARATLSAFVTLLLIWIANFCSGAATKRSFWQYGVWQVARLLLAVFAPLACLAITWPTVTSLFM